jgi:predicted RNA binding protein YcfA (HicA-like mRNA interferase family)
LTDITGDIKLGLCRKTEKLLAAVRNNPRGVRFDELVRLVKALGFTHVRTVGSHEMYTHARKEVPIVNLQPGGSGTAKAYQVRQVLSLIDAYSLEVE